jgi:hypothetical protein
VKRFSAEQHARDVQQIYDTVLRAGPRAGARERSANHARRSVVMRKES